jgi:hypothetical protein
MIRWLVVVAALALQQPGASPVQVVLDTELGRVTIDVDVAHAPVTAANFLEYVQGGFYDGGRFHRTVRPDTETRTDVPIQVVQAGNDPAGRRTPFRQFPRAHQRHRPETRRGRARWRARPDSATQRLLHLHRRSARRWTSRAAQRGRQGSPSSAAWCGHGRRQAHQAAPVRGRPRISRRRLAF